MTLPVLASVDLQQLKNKIQVWSGELGFDGIGISDTEISAAEQYLFSWLKDGCHGEWATWPVTALNVLGQPS